MECVQQTKEDSGERVALVEGVEAGSVLENLAFYCADEVGRPAATGTAGKVQVSWTRGSKKVRLQDGPLALPGIQVESTLYNYCMVNDCFIQYKTSQ